MEIKEVIKTAIQAELDAHNTYVKAVGMVESESAKKLLGFLAQEELKHKQAIEELDLNNLDYDQEKMEELGITEKLMLTPVNELNELQDIIKIAIKREVKENEIYSQMVDIVSDEKLKELFTRLAQEENSHRDLLEKEFNDLLQ